MKTAREYRKEARDLLGNNIFHEKWLYVLLLLLLTSAIIYAAASLTLGIVGVILAGPLGYGVITILLRLARHQDEKADFTYLFNGFKEKFGETVIVSVLTYVYIFLWSLLFVIPGIVKSYSYAATMYLVKEKGLTGNDAITESRKLMDGNKFRLFCLDLSFIGWYILGSLCFGVGVLWVEAYRGVARAAFFEELLDSNGGNVIDVK